MSSGPTRRGAARPAADDASHADAPPQADAPEARADTPAERRPGTPAHGRLLLVPTPLADVVLTPLDQVLPAATLTAAAATTHWIVENAKTARAFLGAVGALHPLALPLQQQELQVLPKHQALDAAAARELLRPALAGTDVGLLSEAGAPCVADPGARVVAAAHALGIEVVPLVGPSSILLGLMASGLDGQRFAFHGYLPTEPAERERRIRELERESARSRQTQVVIETPYRNAALLQALARTLRDETRLCVASDLTAPGARVRTLPAARWRTEPAPDKVPTLFAFLAAG